MTEPALHHFPGEERSADASTIDVAERDQKNTLSHRPVRSMQLATIILFGAPVWGCLMAVSATGALFIANRLQTSHLDALILLFFLGGLLAWPFSIYLGHLLARGRSIETSFTAFFVVITCGTLAMTAFLFAIEYRMFYARWHAPFATRIWFLQFIFTGASAVYQFAVVGMRLFLPFGLACLIGVSMVLAKRIR